MTDHFTQIKFNQNRFDDHVSFFRYKVGCKSITLARSIQNEFDAYGSVAFLFRYTETNAVKPMDVGIFNTSFFFKNILNQYFSH